MIRAEILISVPSSANPVATVASALAHAINEYDGFSDISPVVHRITVEEEDA